MIGFKACLDLGFHSAGNAGQRSSATSSFPPIRLLRSSISDGTAPLRPSSKLPSIAIVSDAPGVSTQVNYAPIARRPSLCGRTDVWLGDQRDRVFIGNAPRHVQPGFLRASVICGMDRPSCPTFIFDSIGLITLERIVPSSRKGVFSGSYGTMIATGQGRSRLPESTSFRWFWGDPEPTAPESRCGGLWHASKLGTSASSANSKSTSGQKGSQFP